MLNQLDTEQKDTIKVLLASAHISDHQEVVERIIAGEASPHEILNLLQHTARLNLMMGTNNTLAKTNMAIRQITTHFEEEK